MKLARAEKDLLDLLPSVTAKAKRLNELRRQIEADRLQRCRDLVAEAAPPDLQQVLISWESRLAELRSQLTQIEKELHRVLDGGTRPAKH